ncbi:hypothetical protein BDZ94DRAFT_858482 [Collybia nuda]|uniref:Uncharacterized protein n=1 Tax=Collybia nuda TaxID=64659 RepID=A0A9P5Y1P9_9AGAR|nr:hypothetical protein BDZ94DRAFT_858482 [Collybia nuda]
MQNSEVDIRPIFPPELERDIFERAARTCPDTGVVLALVSRRVHLWIEPIIYETVTLSNDIIRARFCRTIDNRPRSFFVEHVKSLCIPGDIDPMVAGRILSTCQGVVNLAYWIEVGPPFFSKIASLRPKRLSINIRGLFGEGPPDFAHPFFRNVSHLELVDWPWMGDSTGLALLPHLTHLGVDLNHYDSSIINRLRHILQSCGSLLVLLCLVPSDDAMMEASDALAILNDDRLVILSDSDVLENWEASLFDGSDACQWDFAEDIVYQRKRESSLADGAFSIKTPMQSCAPANPTADSRQVLFESQVTP